MALSKSSHSSSAHAYDKSQAFSRSPDGMAWASQDNNKEYDDSNVEVAVAVVVIAATNRYKIRAPKAMS